MTKFLKLTGMNLLPGIDIASPARWVSSSLYIFPDDIRSMSRCEGDNFLTVIRSKDGETWQVEERPEQILELMNGTADTR